MSVFGKIEVAAKIRAVQVPNDRSIRLLTLFRGLHTAFLPETAVVREPCGDICRMIQESNDPQTPGSDVIQHYPFGIRSECQHSIKLRGLHIERCGTCGIAK